jgi:predicted amidohydrolase YtcJ
VSDRIARRSAGRCGASAPPGAHLAFGSDWPPLVRDPLAGIKAAVSRADAQAPEQLTLKSAINGWTSGAAWASFDRTARA